MNKWRSGKDLGFYDPRATDKDADVTIKASVLDALRMENSQLISALKEIARVQDTEVVGSMGGSANVRVYTRTVAMTAISASLKTSQEQTK